MRRLPLTNTYGNIWIFVLVVSLFAAPAQTIELSKVHLSQGLKSFQNRNYDQALDAFTHYLQDHPESAAGHHYVGLTLLYLEKNEQAIDHFERAAKLDPEMKEIHLSLARAYYQLKNLDKAEAELKLALKAYPRNSLGNFLLGRVYQEKKQFKKSIPHFEIAMDEDPLYYQKGLYRIGRSYLALGKYKQARESFSIAEKLDPKSQTAQDIKKYMVEASTARHSKPWSVEAGGGFIFDDNVNRIEQDLVSGDSDVAAFFEIHGEFRLLEEVNYEVETSYDFFQSVYADLNGFNFQSHDFTLDGKWIEDRWHAGADYTYTYSLLDGDSFLGIHSITPEVGYEFAPNFYTRMNYMFQDKTHFADGRRDAANHSFGIDQFWYFMEKKGHILLGYRLEEEDTDAAQFDYEGHLVTAGLHAPIPYHSVVDLSYKYNERDYDSITPSIGARRDEERHSFKLGLSKDILENLKGRIYYEFVNNNSNLPTTDFTESIVQLSFAYFM